MRTLGLRVFVTGVLALAAGVAAAAEPEGYAGSEACLACHEEQAATLVHDGRDPKDPECESCHGPGAAHVEAGGDASKIRGLAHMSAEERTATCRTCHIGGNTVHWDGSAHDLHDVSCTDCHAVHNAAGRRPSLLAKASVLDTCYGCHKLQRGQMLRSSHMPVRENKLDCADCHNPHGSTTEAMLLDPSINDNCYRCHADKRGPTLFEHPPVRESCLNCHLPHGSMHESMLVSKVPRLCQNCHINSRHPGEPRVPANRFVFNRGCINCHTQVHGSNHPGGIRIMR